MTRQTPTRRQLHPAMRTPIASPHFSFTLHLANCSVPDAFPVTLPLFHKPLCFSAVAPPCRPQLVQCMSNVPAAILERPCNFLFRPFVYFQFIRAHQSSPSPNQRKKAHTATHEKKAIAIVIQSIMGSSLKRQLLNHLTFFQPDRDLLDLPCHNLLEATFSQRRQRSRDGNPTPTKQVDCIID